MSTCGNRKSCWAKVSCCVHAGRDAMRANQCRTHEEHASRPVYPCQVHANGCPDLVVLVAYATACSPCVLSCRVFQRTLCASPNLMLACMQTSAAPNTSLVVRGARGSQRMRSQHAMSAAGMGVASRLSKAATCLQYEDTKLLCTHACSAGH